MQFLHLFFIIIIINLLHFSHSKDLSNEDGPILETMQGTVKGIYLTSRNGRKIYAFLKIPFAEPPVGKLRLRAPVESSGWTGIRDATNDGPSCPQRDGSSILGDEDCLYLNVYTPEKTDHKKLLPVMFFIHGGGLIAGSSSSDIYGSQYFLDQDIVLVTSNYRLGRLGFLTLEDEILPGNWGLKDQLMSLKWIRKYIKDYGGDPNSVTIFGQSAGAISANFHLIVPASKGLFHRVITQSGSVLNSAALSYPGQLREQAIFFADDVNCLRNTSQEIIECFQNLPMESFFLSIFREFYSIVRTLPFSRGIVRELSTVSDAFLTENPYTLLSKPSDIPWMDGINTADGAFLSNPLYSYFRPVVGLMDITYWYALPLILGYEYTAENALVSRSEITTTVSNFYFKGKFMYFAFNEFTDMLTDRGWLCPLVDSKIIYPGPKYVYFYDYVNSEFTFSNFFGTKDVEGPCHMDELINLFYSSKFEFDKKNFTSIDEQLSINMVEMWTNFATYGTPNGDIKNEIWEPVKTDQIEHLFISRNGTLTMRPSLRSKAYEMWNQFQLPKDF